MSLPKFPNKPILPIALPFNIEPEIGPTQPIVSENFVELIKNEMSQISVVELTAEVFADLVNMTHTLRYYFQEPTEKELAALGFYRQGYWLRVRTGSENLIVSIPKVASILHSARLRKLRHK